MESNSNGIVRLVWLRAISSILRTSWWPPSDGQADLQLLVVYVHSADPKTCTDDSCSYFDNLQHNS